MSNVTIKKREQVPLDDGLLLFPHSSRRVGWALHTVSQMSPSAHRPEQFSTTDDIRSSQ